MAPFLLVTKSSPPRGGAQKNYRFPITLNGSCQKANTLTNNSRQLIEEEKPYNVIALNNSSVSNVSHCDKSDMPSCYSYSRNAALLP